MNPAIVIGIANENQNIATWSKNVFLLYPSSVNFSIKTKITNQSINNNIITTLFIVTL